MSNLEVATKKKSQGHPFLSLQGGGGFNSPMMMISGAWSGGGGFGGGGNMPFPPFNNGQMQGFGPSQFQGGNDFSFPRQNPMMSFQQMNHPGFNNFQHSGPMAFHQMNTAGAMMGKRRKKKKIKFFNMNRNRKLDFFQFKRQKRWSKTDKENFEQKNGKMTFSLVIDALKEATKTNDEDEIDSQEASSCGGCIPLDLRKITGSWTQIYGNPESLRTTYTALSTIKTLNNKEDASDPNERSTTTTNDDTNRNDTLVQPACIGFHFERPFPRRVSDAILGEAPISLHFRDDRTYHLYQVSGMVQQSLIPNQSEVRLRISTVDVPMCLIKGGPSPTSGDYDYAIFMEIRGSHRCKALHVITRNSETFFCTYSSDVIKFLQEKVKSNEADSVKIMPNPEQCEPRQQQEQFQTQQQDREGSR